MSDPNTHQQASDLLDDDIEIPILDDADQRLVLAEYGPITDAQGRTVIGRVGSPPQMEATSASFAFWFPDGVLVEDTQLIVTECTITGQTITYYGIVDSGGVRRRGPERAIEDRAREADGDLGYESPVQKPGVNYAVATILRTEPALLTPPREGSPVFLAGPEQAAKAYSADEIERSLLVGLVKNGGDTYAGPGAIDLDYLLGRNGGHLNVNGSAGRGTKSSFLTHMLYMLLVEAARQQRARPSDSRRLRVVPIILNVKNYDLFYLDKQNESFKEEHHKAWADLGVIQPAPFSSVTYLAAQQAGNDAPVATGRPGDVVAYSWSLRDIVENGLFNYLFAEADVQDANFSALVLDIESHLTVEQFERDGRLTRSLNGTPGSPKTFDELLEWVKHNPAGSHHEATKRKLSRRLFKLLTEGKGVLRRNENTGRPIKVVKTDTTSPTVIDLASLTGLPELQRFVVATVLQQIIAARTGANAIAGLVYVVVLDELNRFAPRGARDPITQLIELVAAEMRSRGVILFGAQQQASQVSEKVLENAAIRAIGRTGPQELGTAPWRGLSESAKTKAAHLRVNEKLIIQDNFREPMHVRIPFPPWAMNRDEAVLDAAGDWDGSDLIDS